MTEIQRYLAEEIAEDHADGLVSRREALRRLGLLGLSGAAAASLLAAAVADQAKAVARTGPRRRSRRLRKSADAALATREITFRGPGGRTLMGAWARGAPSTWRRAGDPREPRAQRLDPRGRGAPCGERLLGAGDRPAVRGRRHRVVRRRVRGHGRARGSSSVALRGRHEGGRDGASPPASEEEGRRDRLLLRRRHDVAAARLEGGVDWRLRCRSTAPSPTAGTSPGAKAAVLGIYAELDSRVNATRHAARDGAPQGRPDALRSSRTPTSITRSSTRPSSRYDRAAATAAYRRMIGWFDKYVAT